MSEDTKFYALLTGSNSGLGLSIAHRIIDEFLRTHPPTHHLTLILTTRSASKGAATLTTLSKHLVHNLPPSATSRITLTHYQVDLTNLLSVTALCTALSRAFPKLDYLFLNAGMGAFTGIAWLSAIVTILTGWVHAVTYPSFKIQATGWTTPHPPPLDTAPKLGTVWCANVFGHYYMTAELMGLLAKGKGRIIWTSSLEAYPWTFDAADLQSVAATHSYEATRRLTDVLSLTSTLPATSAYTDSFFAGAEEVQGGRRPQTYITHPGICATAIVPLNIVLWWCMVGAFWVARLLGSPWHTISTYSGARAAVWVAMASDEELEERRAGRVKWGSSVVWGGEESVKMTEVEGEGGEEWEELGRVCWRGMEEVRKEWKGRIEAVGRKW